MTEVLDKSVILNELNKILFSVKNGNKIIKIIQENCNTEKINLAYDILFEAILTN